MDDCSGFGLVLGKGRRKRKEGFGGCFIAG